LPIVVLINQVISTNKSKSEGDEDYCDVDGEIITRFLGFEVALFAQ